MKTTKYLLSLMIISALLSCSKDEEPVLVMEAITNNATDITPVSAQLNGAILELGSSAIIDHGFLISESSDFTGATKLALGSKSDIGDFFVIAENLMPEQTYHYTAYATNSGGEQQFTSKSFRTITPSIFAVEPSQGAAGDEIIISGAGFVEGMKVLFGTQEAEIVELDNTSVKVIVPGGLGIISVGLTVALGDIEYTSSVEFLPIQGKWEQVADFPGVDRNGALGFAVGDKGYIGFGFNTSKNEIYNDFWEYSSTNDSWTDLAGFPETIVAGTVFRVSFAINGVGYAGIGNTSNEFWQYDVQDNLWLRVADFPGTQTGDVYGFVIDGKAYVGRGETSDENREFWMYDPLNDKWTLQTTYPGKWSQNAFNNSTDGIGYIGLGEGRKDIWKYTLSANLWKQMSDFPTVNDRNRFPTSFYINNKLYMGITYGGAGVEWDTNFWQYNETEDTWSQLSNFPFRPARFSSRTVMVINGNGYMGLGTDIGSGFYKFTPPSE